MEPTPILHQILTVDASRVAADGLARMGQLDVEVGAEGVVVSQILKDLGIEDASKVRMALVRRVEQTVGERVRVRNELMQEILSGTFFAPGVREATLWVRHRDSGTNVCLPIKGVVLMIIAAENV